MSLQYSIIVPLLIACVAHTYTYGLGYILSEKALQKVALLYCSTEPLGTYIFSIRVALNGLFTKAGGVTALMVTVLSC